MKTSLIALLMSVALFVGLAMSCGGSGDGGTGGGSAAGGGSGGSGGGGNTPTCFSGTATTNDQLLNACVPDTTEKILKDTPWRAPGTTLPMLP